MNRGDNKGGKIPQDRQNQNQKPNQNPKDQNRGGQNQKNPQDRDEGGKKGW